MTATPSSADDPGPGRPTPARTGASSLAVFWITSMVEGLGVSQIFALVPTYLRQMGVAEDDRLAFVGLFTALIFVVGMPLVPLWGVWADKYSRKAVIVRSALVEAVVFAGVALSREPWQLALSMLLIGFQLGNTGVMLAGIRDVTPRRAARDDRWASSARRRPSAWRSVRPSRASSSTVSAGRCRRCSGCRPRFSVGTALLGAFGSREVRPAVVPQGRVLTWRSARCVACSPTRPSGGSS